jgi:N-acetylglutamate synthase-like GNAT family acetyltransferase
MNSGSDTDHYEFRFMITGGLLASQYVGMDLRVTTTSEGSSFAGNFNTNFGGGAKGEICCVCIETANLSGKKFTDQTGDGISADDTPLAGITVNLYQDFGIIGVLDGADVFYASDVTDVSGQYSFTNVEAGNYLIEEIVPAGYVPTTPTLLAITLAPHDNITTGYDFANFELGSISGKKFNDLDGDGTDDSGTDPGLAGWTIELDKDANGTVDATTVTGPGGTYSFTGLTAGTYRVREVGQAGWIQTTVNPGDVSVVSGTNSTGNNFGNFKLGAISGKKFDDVDGDGTDDGNSDPGLAGWTIELDKDANGTVDATTVTGPGGAYSFTGLTAGTYRIREVGQAGWIQTTVNPGDVTVVSGTNSTGNYFGNFKLGAINGKKFNDIDGDGTDDGGADPGLAGWTIELDKDANGTVDATTVTGPGGTYSFTGLTAGVYRVREVGQAGWIQTTVNPGDVVVVSRTNSNGNDFGNFKLGAISGKKFKDIDGDGTDDGGSDPGLAGWTIELDKDANGTVDATTVTGPGGTYSFTGLTAGTYRIREVGQPGWIQTTVNPGDVIVISGTNSTGNNFGNRQLVPGIDMEKTTNGPTNSNPVAPDYDNEDDEHGPGVPELTPGSTVTWTYKVTNTGQTNFAFNEVVVSDDNGTPGNAADDMSTTNGQITFQSVQAGDADNILEPGEIWLYTASGVVQNVGSGGPDVTFDFSGSSALDGADGNIRTYTSGGLSVKASAWSRDTSGNWTTAWLGAYGGGLGVTDSSEGDGSNNSHTVDNITRDNYVLFEFSESIVVDSAFLGYVVEDSDLRIWIGTKTDPFNNHGTLNDAYLTSLGFTEVNETTLTTTRLADLNNGGISGNVLVIAANTGEATTEDKFKIEKVTVNQHECYENRGFVTVPGATDSDLSHYCNPEGEPGIKIKKFTNGLDADTESGAPQIAPGDTVTWTYHVTNTGTTSFTAAQIVVTDDAGTPGNAADDMSTTNGQVTFQSVQAGDADNILEPGEVWIYQASDVAQDLGNTPASTFNFSGSSATSGTAGNVRTFTAGGVSVKASAFSRDTGGVWSTAWLGSYGGGLGVTDTSEGSGADNSHTVDNITRDNYVLFEFSDTVIIDSAFLGYVVDDSDLRIWIGNAADPFNNHQTLSDAFLTSLGFTEVNETTLTTTRWADLNAGGISGNVLVIAANTAEPTTEDKFKIQKLTFEQHLCYANLAVVTTGPGGPTDSDVSHYCNPTTPPEPGIDIEKLTNGVDADTEADAPEIAPGETVTWTYHVTNTGTVAFSASEVVVTDDNGTPGNAADDFTPTRVLASDVGSDGILSPGEVWTYTASATAQELLSPGAASTFSFAGSSATTGAAGNIRTFTAGGVSVKTSAFSRDASGVWSTAYLGSYSGGLGVTDSIENGSDNTHTVDNVSRDNYVLFEFSQTVVVDQAFLGYVVDDSDLRIWIGTKADPFNSHQTLSDSFLTSLGFTEVNETTLTTTRWADFNAGGIAGNVLVIAANTGEPTTEDRFKIEKLKFSRLESSIYKNVGYVTADGVSDQDASHYKNPDCVEITYSLTGSGSTTGTKGNIKTYTVNNVSVNASAFSRTTSGTWSTAYLGTYSDGLGVTDTSENGASPTQRVDNVGQLNFILFEFSTQVTIDRAFLEAVSGDSDISVFIGTFDNPFHNHLALNDSLFSSVSHYETNTGGSSSRWADFNSNGVQGNVLVIAADVTGTNDQFKISKLEVCAKAVKFYVVDAAADDTFEYGPTGQALANYSLATASSNTGARGVATTAVGDKVWVLDSNKKVYVYDVNGKLLGSWTASGLSTPEDITTNGADIWIVDDGSNKVFKYSGAATRLSGTQAASSNFALNSSNANAKGIVTNGTHLWVVNDHPTSADKVFKYTTSGSLVGSWTIDSRNSNPTGITIDPANASHVWIVDNADDAVYRYHAAASRNSGSQTAASLFALAAGNIDAQGIADPPPSALEIALEPLAEEYRVQTLSRESTSGLKDRVLADWAAVAKTNSSRISSSRPASLGTERLELASSRNSRLTSQLTALDAAFEARDSDLVIKDDAQDWLDGEELSTPDEVVEDEADDALLVAVG